jgi:hypothetical protein
MTARWDIDSLVVGPPAPRDRFEGSARPHGLDPYFRWARHTQWRGFEHLARWNRGAPQGCLLQIIARADSFAALKAAKQCPELKGAIAPSYFGHIPGSGWTARHFTAQLSLEQEDWLLANPLNLRWKLAMPLRDAQNAATGHPRSR